MGQELSLGMELPGEHVLLQVVILDTYQMEQFVFRMSAEVLFQPMHLQIPLSRPL